MDRAQLLVDVHADCYACFGVGFFVQAGVDEDGILDHSKCERKWSMSDAKVKLLLS